MDEPDLAIALRHDGEQGGVPEVAAKGRGALAARIREVAEANGVPVRRDADLAQALAALDVGAPIPVAAFVAVAELLAHIYAANRAVVEATP